MINDSKLDIIAMRLGLSNYHCNGVPIGKFWLFLNSSLSAEVITTHTYFITVNISAQVVYHVTFIYSSCIQFDRMEIWNDLIANAPSDPWMVVGDFNAVIYSSEKIGANPPATASVNSFHDLIQSLSLHDVCFSGPSYTWRNGQKGIHSIKARLDRALVNT